MSESIAQEALDQIPGALFIDDAWSVRSASPRDGGVHLERHPARRMVGRGGAGSRRGSGV
jgi:hypothetical protein